MRQIISMFCIIVFLFYSLVPGSIILSAREKLLIKVFPLAGVPGTDIRRIMAYYDHDPEAATQFSSYGLGKNNILDYMGGDNTYDGHIGTDFGIAGFEEQDIGVPVVAVAGGVVKEVLDGVYDRETEFREGVQGNYVLIDHGNRYMSYYNHLQKGSVCVKAGDKVNTGQQIGRLGSSGASTWPHLHFEWRENGVSVDPFSGPENEIESRWVNQPLYDYPMTIADCGLYYPEHRKKLPFTSTRETYAKQGTSKEKELALWITVLNVAGQPYKRTWKLISPDKKYANEWTDTIDGSKKWHGLGAEVWQYSYRVGFSEEAAQGVWTMEIYHDNELAKIVHFTVADSKPANRAPARPSGGKIYPGSPATGDYITCQIDHQLSNLDSDLDRVRYRFKWTLNGKVVRDVVNATRLDYFPANHAKPGDKLVCQVAASDGKMESEQLEFGVVFE